MSGGIMKKFDDKLEKLNMALESLEDMIEFSNTANIKLEKLDEAIRDSIIKKFEYHKKRLRRRRSDSEALRELAVAASQR